MAEPTWPNALGLVALSLLFGGVGVSWFGCALFRRPGVRFLDAACGVFGFSDPIKRLWWPGVICQWFGLLMIVAGLLVALLMGM